MYCLSIVTVKKLPELFDIIFKNKERKFDEFRWTLLEWAVNLDEGTVKKIRERRSYQRFAAVIVTLMYLVQVYIKFTFFCCLDIVPLINPLCFAYFVFIINFGSKRN